MNKKTILGKISEGFEVFFAMLFGIVLILSLVGKFYHWDKVGGILLPFAFTTDGVFSNTWMFISAALYSLLGIGIIIYLFKQKFIKGDKVKSDGFYYKTIILIVLGVHIFFYITNPWYTLQKFPILFMYQNGTNITNKEVYFFLTEKYGFKSDLYKPFKTLEDSIEGLEFAKKIKEPSLYKMIFEDSEKFGYENLIKNYNNDSFQLYFLNYVLFTSQFHNGKINNLDRNINYLDLLLKTSSSNEIITLTYELKNRLNQVSQLDENQMKQIIDDYLKEYLDKIFNTKIDKSNFL